jgi:hypothetical protein
VLVVESYVLATLRNQRFLSLVELNAAIRQIVTDLNAGRSALETGPRCASPTIAQAQCVL